jgi:REP element-mobilizing transposase RayT
MSEFPIAADLGSTTMVDPIAFFLTWPTYGTWLPGDQRGWVEYHHGWQLPAPALELESKCRMTEDVCKLSMPQRNLCELQVYETCKFRNWQVYAVNCRSNHMHLAIGASNTNPKKIRKDIKAWCTRRLRAADDRRNWWAERGSIRYIWNEDSLATVIEYITQGQDRAAAHASQPDA